MQTLQQLQLGQLMGIKRLQLACELTEFPLEIFELADTLEILDLSRNRLSSLPDDFGRLAKLKIAFFSDNDFTVVPEVLSQCPELTMVGFKANKISLIPEHCFPKDLRWLILTNNLIEEIPATIGNCIKLQKCMLTGNRLRTLPATMANCINLELLRISANNFVELPEWLFSLPKLAWLAIAANPLSILGNSSSDLQSIDWNSLTIYETLGEGASGIISKAEWQSNSIEKKTVAVKVFKGEITSDGLPGDEMLACIAAGKHPNLVTVLGKINAHPLGKNGLVFELIPPEFKNLASPPSFDSCTRDVYKEDTVFTGKEIVKIAKAIASAAEHLHKKGIFHGDLYAHNTLIDENANVIFGDFGAAAIYNITDKDYAAKLEQIEIRAFGCLLDDLLIHIASDDRDGEIHKELGRLCEECFKPKPAQRPDFALVYQKLNFFGI